MYAILGEIPFEMTDGFTALSLRHEARFAYHDVIAAKPRTQSLGHKLDKLEFELRLHWRLGDVGGQYAALVQAQKSQQAQALVTGSGQMMGFFCINQLSVTATATNDTGDVIAMDISVDLTEYSGDPNAPNDAPAIVSADSAPLLSMRDDSINAPIDIETASMMADVGAWRRTGGLLDGILNRLDLLKQTNDPLVISGILSDVIKDGSTAVGLLGNLPMLSAYQSSLLVASGMGERISSTMSSVNLAIGAAKGGDIAGVRQAIYDAQGTMGAAQKVVSGITAKIAAKKPLKLPRLPRLSR